MLNNLTQQHVWKLQSKPVLDNINRKLSLKKHMHARKIDIKHKQIENCYIGSKTGDTIFAA